MKLTKWILTTIFICSLLNGCKSPDQAAYATLATVTQSVKTAKDVYGDLVRAGKISVENQQKAHDVYTRYQASVAALEVAVMTYKTMPDSKPILQKAVEAVSASSSEFVALVQTFAH